MEKLTRLEKLVMVPIKNARGEVVSHAAPPTQEVFNTLIDALNSMMDYMEEMGDTVNDILDCLDPEVNLEDVTPRD